MMNSKPDVLAVAMLHPFYLQALQTIYTIHDRTHTEDPIAFATLAPRIVGVAGTGEASVPRSLLSQLPNAKVVSVFGVGYDGVDVAADRFGVAAQAPGALFNGEQVQLVNARPDLAAVVAAL